AQALLRQSLVESGRVDAAGDLVPVDLDGEVARRTHDDVVPGADPGVERGRDGLVLSEGDAGGVEDVLDGATEGVHGLLFTVVVEGDAVVHGVGGPTAHGDQGQGCAGGDEHRRFDARYAACCAAAATGVTGSGHDGCVPSEGLERQEMSGAGQRPTATAH